MKLCIKQMAILVDFPPLNECATTKDSFDMIAMQSPRLVSTHLMASSPLSMRPLFLLRVVFLALWMQSGSASNTSVVSVQGTICVSSSLMTWDVPFSSPS